ncbi:hypothetical protein ASE77_02255 [Sphingomonas sp. Leaf226]|nr:hypothetical protein ASE77_02255 [Sphingomonas sp. Leaf226]
MAYHNRGQFYSEMERFGNVFAKAVWDQGFGGEGRGATATPCRQTALCAAGRAHICLQMFAVGAGTTRGEIVVAASFRI